MLCFYTIAAFCFSLYILVNLFSQTQAEAEAFAADLLSAQLTSDVVATKKEGKS